MASKKKTPAAAPETTTPQPAAPAKAAPAPEYQKFPLVKDFVAADLKRLKAEYGELKGLENPDAKQQARMEVLRKLGNEVNQRLKVEGKLPPAPAPAKAAPKSVDLKTLAESFNRVIPFEVPVDVNLPEAELKPLLISAAEQLELRDFTPHKTDDGSADAEVFSAQDVADMQALGIKLPKGVGAAPAAPKAGKKGAAAPKATKAPKGSGTGKKGAVALKLAGEGAPFEKFEAEMSGFFEGTPEYVKSRVRSYFSWANRQVKG